MAAKATISAPAYKNEGGREKKRERDVQATELRGVELGEPR